jgi:uncharacterized damage-inducible protein DinB
MSPRFLLVITVLPLAAANARAQQPQHPVADALRQSAERAQRNLVGAAEEMPANKYRFKPTPAQMSFGQLVVHVAGSNEFLCSSISGAKSPDEAKLEPTAARDKLVTRLKRSFDFCSTALAAVTDEKLREEVPFFGGRKVTRAAAMVDLAADWADHYAAAAMYLRLNGLLPPTARRSGAS